MNFYCSVSRAWMKRVKTGDNIIWYLTATLSEDQMIITYKDERYFDLRKVTDEIYEEYGDSPNFYKFDGWVLFELEEEELPI